MFSLNPHYRKPSQQWLPSVVHTSPERLQRMGWRYRLCFEIDQAKIHKRDRHGFVDWKGGQFVDCPHKEAPLMIFFSYFITWHHYYWSYK